MKRITALVTSIGLGVLLFSCTPNNVKVDSEIKKIIEANGIDDATFGIMNNANGEFTVYNLSRYRDSAYLPASTFKIVNSLIGLQTGIISSDSMVIPWDGVTRSVESWNKDLNMFDAFRASSVPYYQEVARRIGKDTMQQWLDTLHYGSTLIKSPIDSFWLDGTLTITPDEQVGLIKQLYFDQLPFFKTYQEMVKRAMLQEDNANYKLGYKTGWSGWDEKTQRHIGWVVGWIEENKHPYFFVLNIESHKKDFDMATIRLKTLKDILTHLEFMEGRR